MSSYLRKTLCRPYVYGSTAQALTVSRYLCNDCIYCWIFEG